MHAAQNGVPIARLQKLLGHASPVMTMRYMKHAPQEFFGEDAVKIAASLDLPSSTLAVSLAGEAGQAPAHEEPVRAAS